MEGPQTAICSLAKPRERRCGADLQPVKLRPQVLDRQPAIGAHHLAFLQCLLEGLPLSVARRNIAATDGDEPLPKQVLAELQAALERAALAAGTPHLAAAIPFDAIARRIDWERRRDRPVQAPSAASVERRKSELYARSILDHLTEREVEDEARTQLMDEAGIRRAPREPLPQIGWRPQQARAALDVLRPLVVTPPASDHAIEVWFRGGTLMALRKADVRTVKDLVALILRRGHRWHCDAPGLGPRRAAWIAAWLSNEPGLWGAADTLGPALLKPPAALAAGELAQVRFASGAIVPFENLVVPPSLDGSAGTNRNPDCLLDDRTDHGAIQRWLEIAVPNAHTRRAYAREAERLLLWCVYEKQMPLSSMTVDTCDEYRRFLLALADLSAPWHWRRPRSNWTAPRASLLRGHPLWRPFGPKPMKGASVDRSVVILRSMFAWMVQKGVGYLKANPWSGMKIPRQVRALAHEQVLCRSLGAAELRFVQQAVDAMERTEEALRARALVAIGIYSGLRREEMAKATTGDLVAVVQRNGRKRHVLRVQGKGGKRRDVTLAAPVEAQLAHYLAARGVPWPPDAKTDPVPLFASVARVYGKDPTPRGGGKPLAAGRLYEIAKQVFEKAAGRAQEAGEDDIAARLRTASTHWLRHTFGTQLGQANVDLRTIMLQMGHANVATTLGYISPDYDSQFDQLDRVFGS